MIPAVIFSKRVHHRKGNECDKANLCMEGEEGMSKTIRIALVGFGTVAISLLKLIDAEKERLWKEHRCQILLVGASDSKGIVLYDKGLPLHKLMIVKWDTGSVAHFPVYGQKGGTALDMIANTNADIIIESSPAHLPHGEPGIQHILKSLELGKHVVSANKAPLVLAWTDIMQKSKQNQCKIRYGAAASAGLPVLEMGALLGLNGEILEFAGVFNATSQYIINQMEQGVSYQLAIAQAQAAGFAEADPSVDVDGWDTAMKTILLANTFLGSAIHLNQVYPVGIRQLSMQDISEAAQSREEWRLVGRVTKVEGEWIVQVQPERLACHHPLAMGSWKDKTIVIQTRNLGEQVHVSRGGSGKGTAATVLTDILEIARDI